MLYFRTSLICLISILFIGVMVSPLAIAGQGPGQQQSLTIENPLGTKDFSVLAGKIIDWIANIGIAIAVIMIIYAGLLFMTSGGNDEKVAKAKKALIWSLIGLAVLIMGKAWIALIKDILQAK